MDNVELSEVVKVTEEVEKTYNQIKAPPPKKRKKKAHGATSMKPKKPRSAYLLYYFDFQQAVQHQFPQIPQSEVNKRVSESWRTLSVAEKNYYIERARMEKDGVETASQSPFKHLPGFRKILPRGGCFVISREKSTEHPPASSLLEMTLQPRNISEEGDQPSTSTAAETHLTSLGLAEEVELEHQVITEDAAQESVEFSDVTINGEKLKQNETRLAGNHGSNPPLEKRKRQGAHVAETASTRPMLMLSLGSNSDQIAKPTYKMIDRTYTRRGRGKCPNPDCTFLYVTRHKPPTCPECGRDLGGKLPTKAKKTQKKDEENEQPEQECKSESENSKELIEPPKQEEIVVTVAAKCSEESEEGEVQPCPDKQQESSAGAPPEGSNTNPQIQNGSSAAPKKRTLRPILPAICNTGGTFIQIFTVPTNNVNPLWVRGNKSLSAPPDNLSALKPSTIKQLGQGIALTRAKQDFPVSASRKQPVSSLKDQELNFVSVVPFNRHTVPGLKLGLSTSRGRGRCKNPVCDFIYNNRHKPANCPTCGYELRQNKAKKSEKSVDPFQALTPAQLEVQRQSTLQLLRNSLQFPENESEFQETLAHIEQLNALKIILIQVGNQQNGENTETLLESGWPQLYESAAAHCGLCGCPLFKGGQSSVAGQEDCWLLTEKLLQAATLQLKVCLNPRCLALHSFTDLLPGLFNIGNRLLVSIDLFLKIRASIKQGQSPSQAAQTLFDHIQSHPVHSLNSEESSQIQELLLTGYWAFESLTVRDYNDMICGICGVAPKFEIARRETNCVLELKSVEFTWPGCSTTDEVHVDDFWLTMESEAIEQAAFPVDIPITRVDASIIAPFIPPLMRGTTVINTEKDKLLPQTWQLSGDPSVLVRLVHDGQLKIDNLNEQNEVELKAMLDRCGIKVSTNYTKTDLVASLAELYTRVQSGLPTSPQPSVHLTAGKLSKVCPHKVVSSSKYLVRGETARDHVDLLLSSRYWPPVYISDCARQVALCADLRYPSLATQMWGRNQGCFSDPLEKPEHVSCDELQDQPHHTDLSLVVENQQVHPITKSSSCWMVCPPRTGKEPPLAEHHSMRLCTQLEPYISPVAELLTKEEEESDMSEDIKERSDDPASASNAVKQSTSTLNSFNNTAYYYLYNRLVDYIRSKEIVSHQINQVLKDCQPGEVVIRDALYRLGVAQINTEKEEDEENGAEEQAENGVGEI